MKRAYSQSVEDHRSKGSESNGTMAFAGKRLRGVWRLWKRQERSFHFTVVRFVDYVGTLILVGKAVITKRDVEQLQNA